MNLDEETTHILSHIFCCSIGSLPLKYLGVPLHHSKLHREDIQPLVDTIIKRIADWRGKLLSIAGRLVLIKSCLASIPIYLLSFIKFPKWAINLINSHMAHCLWNDLDGNRSYHLVNWPTVCLRKEYGGLGIPDLRDLNICLLGSWLKRYNDSNGKLWKQLVDFKYDNRNPNIFSAKSQHGSQFWKGVVWAAQAAKLGYRWHVGKCVRIKFWEDNWLGPSSLAVQFGNCT